MAMRDRRRGDAPPHEFPALLRIRRNGALAEGEATIKAAFPDLDHAVGQFRSFVEGMKPCSSRTSLYGPPVTVDLAMLSALEE
jgi:hypothetical protein